MTLELSFPSTGAFSRWLTEGMGEPFLPGMPIEGVERTLSDSEEAGLMADSEKAGLMAEIRRAAYKHSRVESVYMSIGDERLVDYWIVIGHRDIALIRSLIEDQQKQIVDLFARTENPPFHVDFHIIYREGREVTELVPSNALLIPRS